MKEFKTLTGTHDCHTLSPSVDTSCNWTSPVTGQLCLVLMVSASRRFDCTPHALEFQSKEPPFPLNATCALGTDFSILFVVQES